MSGLWAVLVREIRERRAVFLAALTLGILPIVVGVVPALKRPDNAVRDSLALILGFAFPAAVALLLGASVIGRDVAERRLGFYFSRPISGFVLWAGKMGATFILLGASVLLVSLPAHLVTAGSFTTGVASEFGALTGVFFGLGFLILALCAAGAHAAGVMLRSRDGILPVDLVLLIATLVAFGAAALRINRAGAPEMFLAVMFVFLWGTLAAFLAAGALQVVGGRSDSRRGHIFLSVALWGFLLAGAGVLHLALSWAFAMTPADLTFGRGTVVGAPRGSHFVLGTFRGGRLGYRPTFLVDADSGRFVRLGTTDSAWAVAFAPQGQRAVWMNLGQRHTLGVAALDAPSPRVSEVLLPSGVGEGEYSWILALSPQGERVLIQDSNGAGVVETDAGRLVVQAKPPRVAQAYFESNDLVRLLGEPTISSHEVVLLEWNLRTGQLRETGRFGDALRVVDLQAGHLLVAMRQQGLEIRNAETGHFERTVLPASAERAGLHPDRSLLGRFLADGRVAVVLAEKDGAHLRVFADKASADLDVRVGRLAGLIGESVPGELILQDRTVPGLQTLFVDATTGEIRKKETGIEPVASPWRDFQKDGVAGAVETRLFISQEGALVNRDPLTGERRVLWQGQKPRDEE